MNRAGFFAASASNPCTYDNCKLRRVRRATADEIRPSINISYKCCHQMVNLTVPWFKVIQSHRQSLNRRDSQCDIVLQHKIVQHCSRPVKGVAGDSRLRLPRAKALLYIFRRRCQVPTWTQPHGGGEPVTMLRRLLATGERHWNIMVPVEIYGVGQQPT